MNGTVSGKRAKRSKSRPEDVLPVLPDTKGDLFWEMNEPGTEFKQNVVGIVVVRADGSIGYINPYLASLVGESPADMVNEPILDFVAERDRAAIAEVVKDCVSGKRRFVQLESTVTHKSGKVVDIFVDASAAVFEGQPAVVGAVIDISARKQAEAELRASETKLANALKIVDAADWEYDVLADRFTFDDNFYRMYHTTAKAVGGYTMSSADYAERFVHPDDRETVGAEVKAAIETDDPNFSRTLEHHILYADGTTGWVSVRFVVIKDEAGRTIKTHGVNQDITARKQAEQALADSESRLQAALTNISQGLLMHDAQGRMILFNRRFAEIFQLPQDQMRPGMTIPDIMALAASHSGLRDLDPEATLAHAEKAVRNPEGGTYVQRLNDGRSIASSFEPMPDGGVVVTFEDITKRKQAEQALADSEAKLQAALSNMSQGLVMIDAEGKLVLHNSRLEEIYGLPPELVKQGMTVSEAMALGASATGVQDVNLEATLAQLAKVLEDPAGGTQVQRLSDGRSIAETVQPMPDGGLVVTFEDITKRKQAEQALADSETKLQTALTNMSQGLLMLGSEGGLILFNRRFAEIFGLPQDQILPGMTLPELMALAASTSGVRDLDPEGTIAHVQKTVRGTESGSFVVRLNDGRSIADTYQPMPGGGIVVTFEDITDRRQAEQALAASEAKLQTALTNMSQGLAMLDPEGGLVLFNRRFAEIFLLSQDQILPGMTLPEIIGLATSQSGVGDLDPEGTMAQVEKIFRGTETGSFVVHLSDGRSIADTYQPMPGGGMVVTFEDITPRWEAEQALADSEAKLQAALTNMSQGLVVQDAEGRLVVFNDRFAEILGMPPDQILPGMAIQKLMALAASYSGIGPVDPEGLMAQEEALRGTEGGSFVIELSDGRSIYETYRPMPDGGHVLTFEDITDRKQAELALADSEAKLQAALSNMSQGLLMIDAKGKLTLHNSRLEEIFNLPPEAIKSGMTVSEAMAFGDKSSGVWDVSPEETLAQLAKVLQDPAGGTYVQRLSDGRSISETFQPMPEGGVVVTFEDITQRLADQAEIQHMAQFDALTDLPNRVSFYDQLDTLMKHQRPGESVGVLSLDLDHFKAVNDTLGHPIGDLLLQTAARRMQSCLRGGDIPARLGGDEFAIIQTPVEDPSDITALASRLIEVVAAPYDFDGRQVIVGVSVGVAVAPGDGEEPDILMKNADLALYRAKADGGGVYRFFEPKMDARMQARRLIELDLRKAIHNGGEFELLYQPMVDLKTGNVASCEALLRWSSPERGLVMPDEFIPVAEATGLIVPLGEWVLYNACVEAARWPEEISVSVNLSPAQFKSKRLVQSIKNALAESGLPASRLELEITEQVLMKESEGAFVILRQIRDLGIRISMDDFGTGHSSIGYLRAFPFSKIKIDKSFVRDLPGKKDSIAIVRAVVGLSSSLGMQTIAEGVETEEQLASVTSEGCDLVQGFFFSKPRPSTEVKEFFKAQAEGAMAAFTEAEEPKSK